MLSAITHTLLPRRSCHSGTGRTMVSTHCQIPEGRHMAEQGQLTLHYRGGDADRGEFDYYTAATAMMAFGDLMGEMSTVLYGKGTGVDTRVRHIAPEGSILFDFTVHVAAIGQAALFGPTTPETMWDLFKQSIDAWRFLKGHPPVDAQRDTQTNHFSLTNIDGDVYITTDKAHSMINTPRAGDAAEQLFRQPMETAGITDPGITEIEVSEGILKDAVRIDAAERHCFVDVSQEQVLLDNTTRRILMIESPTFREGNKWQFSDGQSLLMAAIKDSSFWESVHEGAQFAEGDKLVVELNSVQRSRGRKVHMEHTITRVISHERRGGQHDLDL